MPKLPRLTPEEAEKKLLYCGFHHIRSKGSHRIYQRGNERFIKDPFSKELKTHKLRGKLAVG